MNLTLQSVYRDRRAARVLYNLLEDRVGALDINISHNALPPWRDHVRFVKSKPYRVWYIIKADGLAAGTVYATRMNEVGIHLFPDYRGKHIAQWALKTFLSRHKPLAAIPTKRVGAWLANINPKNKRSIDFFEKAGFTIKQYTYQRTEEK